MIDIATLRVGDRVHYHPTHSDQHGSSEWENGRVKEIRPDQLDGVWVVYHCGGDWDNYENYTSALTNLRDLKPGWRFK